MLNRGLVGAITGLLGGVSAGAFILGLNRYLSVGSSFLGPTSDWWRLDALVGAFAGAVAGLVLGTYISLSQSNLRSSMSAGSVVGLIGAVAIFLLVSDLDWQLRSWCSRLIPLMLSVIIWMSVGLVIGAVTNKLFAPRSR